MSVRTSSLIGSAAAMCIERGAPDSDERLALWRKRNQPKKPTAKPLSVPLPEDAVPDGLCWRCGLVGEHGGPGECIEALRSTMADLMG